jgi:hypothetical protein
MVNCSFAVTVSSLGNRKDGKQFGMRKLGEL